MMTTTTLTATAAALAQAAGGSGAGAAVQEMTAGGWVFMAGAWFCILLLVYYTFSKVLRGKK